MGSRPLDQIRAAIEPGDAEAAAAARAALAGRPGLGALEWLAIQLASARHTALPPTARKLVVAVAADRPGAAAEPTMTDRAAAIAAGLATVNVVARAAGARVAVVDAGLVRPLGAGAIALRPDGGAGVFDRSAAERMAESGAALALSLAGDGLDVLAIGGLAPVGVAARAALELVADDADPFAAVAAAAAPGVALLAGVCLGAAAVHIPVVADAELGAIAAACAVCASPAAVGSIIVGHRLGPAARPLEHRLGDRAAVDAGMTAEGGASGALALPVLDLAARLLREPPARRGLPLAP